MKPPPDRDQLLKAERRLLDAKPSGGIRAAVVYPNRYWVAMSNLGFQTVYRLWHDEPCFAVDRVYMPDRENERPKLFESQAEMNSAELLGFSVSFEADYLRVVKMLEYAGLPLQQVREAALRLDYPALPSEGRPLLLAGGAAVTINPEPLAPFFDVMIIGEAEEVLPEFNAAFIEAHDKGLESAALLERLSRIEGVYIPSLYQVSYHSSGEIQGISPASASAPQRVSKRFVKDLDPHPAATAIQTAETEFRSMYLLETGRGCETGCRFCAASYAYRPVRRRSYSSLCSCMQQGIDCAESVGFVGAAVSSHPALPQLFGEVSAAGKRAALSSVMTHRVTHEFADVLASSGYRSVALAPETGTESLRFRMGKRILDEQILQAAERLVASGVKTIRLYFMVGLPGESAEDVAAVGVLVDRIRQRTLDEGLKCRPHPIAPTIQVSLNPFIPKPWTPFQRHGMAPLDELKKKIGSVKKAVSRLPNCEIKAESPRESYAQAVWSRGDRRIAALLIDMVQEDRDWRWLVKNANKSPAPDMPGTDFYANRMIGEDEMLPWEIVDMHIPRDVLEREYRSALSDDGADEIQRARRRLTNKEPD